MLSTIEATVTAIVCLITAMVIQRIYTKERLYGADLNAIKGIKWFGFAILAWGLGAIINLLFVTGLDWSLNNKYLIYSGVLISLANSLFILLSLPSIEHQRERGIIVRLVQRFSTKEFVGLYCGVLGMIAFVFIATSFNNPLNSNNLIWLIDIPISLFVALALLFELNKAFAARQMKFMFLPTFSLFLLILVAVTHRIIPQDRAIQVIDQDFWALAGSITAISFKFLFILLFSILLYSWKFLSEKEQQQTLAAGLSEENLILKSRLGKLELSNERHLDTITHMKSELSKLKEASKITLSDRQKEVLGNLALLGTEKSYSEVAEAMHISLDGFQTHVHQIKKVLNISGAGGKKQLIDFAKDQDFIRYATLSKNVQPHG